LERINLEILRKAEELNKKERKYFIEYNVK